MLWAAFAVLTLLALLVVVAPVIAHLQSLSRNSAELQEAASVNTSTKQVNLVLFQERLKELASERSEGKIGEAEYQKLKKECERTLLNDVEGLVETGPETASAVHKPRAYALGLISLIGIPIVSVAMYTQLGSYGELQQAKWTQQTQQVLAESSGDVGDALTQLEAKLASNPEYIDGWVLLGRSYLSMQRYPEAGRAFEQLIRQLKAQGQNPAPGYGLLAQSIYFANGTVTPGVQSALDKALSANPNEGNALSLMGISAFQQERYEDAIRHWQQIIEANPNDPNIDALRSGVARAEQLIEEQGGGSQTVGSGQAETANTELQVQVSLAANMQDRINPSDTLFVLARPVGARMPLAVARHSAAELPLAVTLNDSMAMGPMAKLSSAEQVEIIARISKSGTPQPQPGDIEGLAGPVVVSQQEEAVVLVIDKVLP